MNMSERKYFCGRMQRNKSKNFSDGMESNKNKCFGGEMERNKSQDFGSGMEINKSKIFGGEMERSEIKISQWDGKKTKMKILEVGWRGATAKKLR